MKRALLVLPRLVLPLLVLPACGGAEDLPDLPDLSAATSGPSPSPSAAPEPSPTAEAPQPSARPSRPALPSSPSAVPSGRPTGPAAAGDVDGDGQPDEVTYDGDEAVVALSGGGRLRASTAADIAADGPVTAGVEDLDRDGRAEVFVQVGQGSSTAFLVVLRFDGRTLAPLTVDGRPRLVAFGGSVTHGDGFSCTETGALVVRSATSEDGEAYALETVTYRVEGHALVETGRTSGTAAGQDDPAVAAAYVVDCRSVGEGT